MNEQNEMQLFEDQPIRTAWDAENEEWFFPWWTSWAC